MGYNANRQQPVSMKVDRTDGSDTIIDYAYDYYDAGGHNNGRIRQITDNVDQAYTTTYTYDAYNRLTQATASAYSRYYAHDAWGNISNFSSTTFSYATNASGAPATNRIATATNGQGTVGLSYDAAGNLTQDGSAVYNYDAANRLKEVGVGGSNTYGYDGDGMRVRQSSGGAAMFYVRSSVLKNVAMEVTATGGAVRAYIQAGNKTVAMSSRDGQFYWLHTNHLNSSRAMTDINGTLVYKGQYDPYGKALLEWSATNDTGLNTRKFTGYERDATGLDYANARMYASERGRFLQPDPIGMGAANAKRPQSLNRYSYVGNDPVNFLDPGGTCRIYWDQINDDYGEFRTTLCDRDDPDIPQPESAPGAENLGGGLQYDPRADFRDYALQLSNNETISDCLKLALLAYKAGQIGGSPEEIIGRLLSGLTEFTNKFGAPSDRNFRVGVYSNDPNYGNGFGSSGFRTAYHQNPPSNNQVRHATAWMAAGYYYGTSAALALLYIEEQSVSLSNPDVALGVASIAIGDNFDGDFRALAQNIWRNVCGENESLNLP